MFFKGKISQSLAKFGSPGQWSNKKLIQELDQEEKNMVFKMIKTFLTKKKFKDFCQKNVAAL